MSCLIIYIHIQILLYVLDGSQQSYLPKKSSSATSSENRAPDLPGTLKLLYNGIKLYDEKLLKKPSVLFINKSDVKGKYIVLACVYVTSIYSVLSLRIVDYIYTHMVYLYVIV